MATEGERATKTPPQNINEGEINKPDYECNIEALKREIESLKEKVETKDYIIDDLFTELGKTGDAQKMTTDTSGKTSEENICDQSYERLLEENEKLKRTVSDQIQIIYEIYDERDKLKKKISKLNDDDINSLIAERDEVLEKKSFYQDKVKEYEKIVKEMEDERKGLKDEITNLQKKFAVAQLDEISKESLEMTVNENLRSTNEVNQYVVAETPVNQADTADDTSSKTPEISGDSDSGVDLPSLTKLIDDRVDAKLREYDNPKRKTSSDRELVEAIYVRKSESTNKFNTEIEDSRELNIIIHGLEEKESGKEYDREIIKQLFDTVGIQYAPCSSADRLGRKTTDRTRPIRLSMETKEEKRNFMSMLGKLKYGPEVLRKISITDDYTQEERNEIRQWVEEAKNRTRSGEGYIWKVRGSPTNGLRLIKMKE